MPLAARIHAHCLARHAAVLQIAHRVQGVAGLLGRIAAQHRFHRHGLHHQRLIGHEECKALTVSRLEGSHNGGQIAKGHHQGGVTALVAHMHTPVHLHRPRTHLRTRQLGTGGALQCVQLRCDARQRHVLQAAFHRLLTVHGLVGKPHAIGTEHSGQRVHQHLRHAQRIRHQASVLAPSTAKTLQRVAGHVVAARHRDFLDGVGHLLHGNGNKAFGHGLGRAPGLLRQGSEVRAHHLVVERFVGMRPKHFGEVTRLHLADHHVGIGHRQRAASAVAGRAGVGTSTLGPDTKARAVKAEEGAATRSHGVDAHHGRAHAHTGHGGFELTLEGTGKVAYVGGSAAHVKADHLVLPRQRGGARHAHDAPGRPAQDGVLALKSVRIGQPAAGLHEEELHTRHFGRHLLHIAAQDGRQVGIHHRGVAAAHKLHERTGLMRGADLGKAHRARQPRCRLFVFRIAVAVHEYNRNTP